MTNEKKKPALILLALMAVVAIELAACVAMRTMSLLLAIIAVVGVLLAALIAFGLDARQSMRDTQ